MNENMVFILENDADLDLYDVLTTISGRSRKVVKAFCYQKGLRPRGLPANIDNVVGQLLEFQYNGPETDDNFVELDLDASDEGERVFETTLIFNNIYRCYRHSNRCQSVSLLK